MRSSNSREAIGAGLEVGDEELAEVEAALRRLVPGVYGECTDCGRPIPLQRLLAQPTALPLCELPDAV